MNLICINCPLGCHLTVEKNGEEIIVTGNSCPRGEAYAVSEMTDPKRILTTTLEIINGKNHKRLPVISSAPISKDKIMDVMKYLKDKKVNLPINMNDIVVENVLGLGVDMIASRTMED